MQEKKGLLVLNHRAVLEPETAAHAAPGISSAGVAADTIYPAPRCASRGRLHCNHGSGHGLWSIASKMEAGAELQWEPEHGDEAMYVLSGSVLANGKICTARGTIILEANVVAQVRALETSRVIHFGADDPIPPSGGPFGPADPEHHAVRVVSREQARRTRIEAPDGTVYVQHYYADGSEQTSRLALFSVHANGSADATLHHHTEAEIIHVLKGELHFGTLTAQPGMAVAIASHQRYGFKTNGPFEFLNYRRDASYVITNPGSPPYLEVFQGEVAQPERGWID